ncbi:MAG: ABC transporter permease [Blastochloris sp.]|nr:ABC transporter permease [Blastochloris sp.]
MNLWLGVAEGLREIWSHKFRSFLTMLGIILGVASLIAMFSLTAGMAEGARRTLTLWGGLANVEVVEATVPEEQEGIRDISPGRTYRDVMALRQSASLVELVSPELQVPGQVILTRRDKTVPIGWMRGVEPEFLEVERQRVGQGRFFTDLDLELRNRVIVLGPAVVKQLWAGESGDPVGEKLGSGGAQLPGGGGFREFRGSLQGSGFGHAVDDGAGVVVWGDDAGWGGSGAGFEVEPDRGEVTGHGSF